MSITSYFYEAFIFGFVLASIIGPTSMLCIKKTLELGFAHGMAVGIGAALSSCFYGFIVGAGMTVVSDFLLEQTFYIKLIGGLFLLYLAYKEVSSKANPEATTNSNRSFLKLISQTFFLTSANPLTILVFLAMFANIGDGNTSFNSAAAMIAGVTLGSIAWWTILCSLILKIKHRLSDKFIYCVRMLSAAVLAAFGLWSIYDLLS